MRLLTPGVKVSEMSARMKTFIILGVLLIIGVILVIIVIVKYHPVQERVRISPSASPVGLSTSQLCVLKVEQVLERWQREANSGSGMITLVTPQDRRTLTSQEFDALMAVELPYDQQLAENPTADFDTLMSSVLGPLQSACV
jgi:hypothetical protein